MPFRLERVRLRNIRIEDDITWTLVFSKPDDLIWTPGSNTHLAFSDFINGDTINRDLVRHMSINSTPESGEIHITTRLHQPLSEYKNRLSKLRIGDEMVIFGTDNHIPLKRMNKGIVLISMGIGLSTFRPMIIDYQQDKTGIKGMTSINVDKRPLRLYQNIFKEDTQNYYAKDRAKFFGLIDDTIKVKGRYYYIVGSNGFLKDIIDYLLAKGVNKKAINIDKTPEGYEYFGL